MPNSGLQAAIELTADAPITIPFRWGRTDAASCVFDGPTRLPAAEGNQAEIERVFVIQMGLTFDDAVACGNCDIILDHLSRTAQLHLTPTRTPCYNLRRAYILIGCRLMFGIQCCDQFGTSGCSARTRWAGPSSGTAGTTARGPPTPTFSTTTTTTRW